MQSHIEEIRALDGEVVAISTDAAEHNRTVKRRFRFDFFLLSDPDLKAIDAYGLRHADGGLAGDIARPAVFVVDREGAVAWRQLTDNWRVRVRINTVLAQLEAIR